MAYQGGCTLACPKQLLKHLSQAHKSALRNGLPISAAFSSQGNLSTDTPVSVILSLAFKLSVITFGKV